MVNLTQEQLNKLNHKFPKEMEHIEMKVNMLSHIYFKLLDFVEKLGLKTEFLNSLNFTEKEIFHGIGYCRTEAT